MADVVEYQSAPVKGAGVYYRREDFPGLFVRTAVVAIDLVVLVVAQTFLAELMIMADLRRFGPISMFAFAWVYLVLAKRAGWTVAYRAFGLRVVDLTGRPAGVVRLTWRTGVAAVLNPVVDLLWAASDRSGQPMRDKLSGTYVVKRNARPAGTGEVGMANVFLMGMNLIYREVKRPAA